MAYKNLLNKASFPLMVAVMGTLVAVLFAQRTSSSSGQALRAPGDVQGQWYAVAAGQTLPFVILTLYAMFLRLGPRGSPQAFKP